MKKFRRLLATLVATITVVASTMTAFAEDETLDKSGEYKARLGFQAQTADEITWVQRIGYYHSEDGDQVYQGSYGGESTTYYDGTFTDAEIKGNGTYTVSYTTSDIAGVERFTQLHVATNIPENEDLEFTNLIVKINDKTMGKYLTAYVDDDSYADDYCVLLAFNHWRSYCNDNTAAIDPLCIPATGDITISITFTVSGFDYDNAEQKAAEEAAKNTTTAPAADEATGNNGGLEPWVIVVIAVAVVAGVVAVVMVTKKGKKN